MINETSDNLIINANNKSETQEIRVKNCLLSIDDKKIRRDWLRSLYAIFLGNICILIGNYVFLARFLNKEVANESIGIGLAGLMSLCIALTIVYVFAYKKFGTKWIGFSLVVSPIQYSVEIIKDLVDFFSLYNAHLYLSFIYLLYIFFRFRFLPTTGLIV
jgi:hypothetical protein